MTPRSPPNHPPQATPGNAFSGIFFFSKKNLGSHPASRKKILEIFWKISGNFLESFWKFSGNFLEIFWKFSGKVFFAVFSSNFFQKISRKFPENFQKFSRKFPEIFQKISRKFPEFFLATGWLPRFFGEQKKIQKMHFLEWLVGGGSFPDFVSKEIWSEVWQGEYHFFVWKGSATKVG